MCTFLDQLLSHGGKLVGYSMTGATLGECGHHFRFMLSVLILVTPKQACNLWDNIVLTLESVRVFKLKRSKPTTQATSCQGLQAQVASFLLCNHIMKSKQICYRGVTVRAYCQCWLKVHKFWNNSQLQSPGITTSRSTPKYRPIKSQPRSPNKRNELSPVIIRHLNLQ